MLIYSYNEIKLKGSFHVYIFHKYHFQLELEKSEDRDEIVEIVMDVFRCVWRQEKK